MSNEITIGVLVIAIVALTMSAYSLATPTDTSDFVSISEQLELVAIVKDFHNTDPILCDSDPECVKFFARKFVTEDQINPVINDLVAVDDQLRTEIVKNSDNFKDNHPFNFEPEEFEVVGEVEAFSFSISKIWSNNYRLWRC